MTDLQNDELQNDELHADHNSELDLNVPMTPVRRRLPDIRMSLTHKFEIDGHKGYVTVGLYDDGTPGELFIKMAKQGSTLSGFVDTVGILTSLALQYGVPIDALARKLEYMRFEPSGWTSHKSIRRAHSIVDYIFRWLKLTFSDDRLSEGQLPPSPERAPGDAHDELG